MARNVEIKARITSVAALEARVAALADAGPTPIAQDDSFFHCAQGRLKLRVFADGHGELIAYQRSDTAGPKLSDHVRAPVADPAALREALTRACGLRGRVVKQRTLYLVGATRLHLDVVEGLGDFLELEVVLRDTQTFAEGEAVAQGLLAALGITPTQLESQAYIDLLEQRPAASRDQF
jgi:predicted adenylyl cyclase CyaB